jgi:DNA-binding winged helix-turn-helix (wHTH) protein
MLEVRVKFGDYELDGQQYLLSRLGQSLKLERIPMELLLFLVERHGQLVTREQIIERLWGKDVFVDTDNSINTAIRKIRKTLKDHSEQPRFVQTIPGKSYRFIATVAQVGTGSAAEETRTGPVGEVNQRRPRFISYTVLGLGSLLVAVLAGSWTWRSWRRPSVTAAPPVIHSLAVLPWKISLATRLKNTSPTE